MGMVDSKLLNRYMNKKFSELQKSSEEIKQYAENSEYGLSAIKNSISGNKGSSFSQSVCLDKSHKLTRLSNEHYTPPDGDAAIVFDVPEGTSGIIKMLTIKFTAITTATDTSQDFPLILRDKSGKELFNFYIYQPRHSGASGTRNSTITVDLIPPDKIDTYKMYSENNNASIAQSYVFDNSNIAGNTVYGTTASIHIVTPEKGIAFKNGFTLWMWIAYGYNSNNYADCKLIYEKD